MTADSSTKNTARPRPTVDDLRRRARNRLIGAALLVVIAIVLFGFLFDTKPRSMTEEIDFAIPEQGQVKPIGTEQGQHEIADLSSSSGVVVPLDAPMAAPPNTHTDAQANTGADTIDGADTLSPNEEFVGTWDDDTAAQERAAAARANIAQAEQKNAQKLAQEKAAQEKAKQAKAQEQEQAQRKAEQKKAEAAKARAKAQKAAQKKAEEARVQAILSGEKNKPQPVQPNSAQQTAAKASNSGDSGAQYIVQFGSLKDPVRAEAVRAEVAAKGLSAYTQTANTSKGTYTRLRSGPYNSKAAADAAAATIKAMGHPVLVKKSN